MTKREEIEALKAEIEFLKARVMMLEWLRLGAQPLIQYVPAQLPTTPCRPWEPIWGPSTTTAGAPSLRSKYNG